MHTGTNREKKQIRVTCLTIFILLALKAGVRTRLLFFHSSPLDEDTPSYILPWTRVTIMPRFSCEGENYKLLKSIIYVRTNKHKTKQDWDKLHSKQVQSQTHCTCLKQVKRPVYTRLKVGQNLTCLIYITEMIQEHSLTQESVSSFCQVYSTYMA